MNLLLDPVRMIRDITAQGALIGAWGALLNIPQVVGGLLFIGTLEGRVVLITVLFTQVVAGQIHRRSPFSRLIGICHLPWLVLLPWLVHRVQSLEQWSGFRIWLAFVAATIAVSLVFDAMDLFRFARGKKTFSWATTGGDQ